MKIIEPVLIKYAEIFHDDENNDFKSTNVVVHKIETGDSAPIREAPYKTPFSLRQKMNRQVQKMLDKSVISPSHSLWSSPAVLVPKKSESGVPKYRFCMDCDNKPGFHHLRANNCKAKGRFILQTRIQNASGPS